MPSRGRQASWPKIPISDFTKTSAGGTPKKSNAEFYEGGDIPWLLSGEVASHDITVAAHFLTPLGLASSSAKIFPPRSVLVAMYGATAGEVGILRFRAATNQAVCAIYPSERHVPEYLYYYLLYIKPSIVAQAVGNAQPNISQAKVKATLVLLPPLNEQKRIVAALDRAFAALDRARANAEANLADASTLFDSWISSAFKLGADNWPITTLPKISKNLDRSRVPIAKRDRESGGIPYYGASGIVDHVSDFIFEEDLLLISEDGANLLARAYPIAFSISGKSWVNNHAHVLRFNDATLQEFVRLYLNTISLEPYVSGMAQPKLNQRLLNAIPMPYPGPHDRARIVAGAEEMQVNADAARKNYDEQLTDIAALRQSLLQKAFAGELV